MTEMKSSLGFTVIDDAAYIAGASRPSRIVGYPLALVVKLLRDYVGTRHGISQ